MSQIYKNPMGGETLVNTLTGTSPILVNGVAGTPESGDVTLSLAPSPCFSAFLDNSVTDVTGDGTNYSIVCDAVMANPGGDYSTATGIYTAPTTGNYMFTASVTLTGITTAHTAAQLYLRFNGSGGYVFEFNPAAIQDSNNIASAGFSIFFPVPAGTQINLTLEVFNSSKVIGLEGENFGQFTYFSGFLFN